MICDMLQQLISIFSCSNSKTISLSYDFLNVLHFFFCSVQLILNLFAYIFKKCFMRQLLVPTKRLLQWKSEISHATRHLIQIKCAQTRDLQLIMSAVLKND